MHHMIVFMILFIHLDFRIIYINPRYILIKAFEISNVFINFLDKFEFGS